MGKWETVHSLHHRLMSAGPLPCCKNWSSSKRHATNERRHARLPEPEVGHQTALHEPILVTCGSPGAGLVFILNVSVLQKRGRDKG